MKSNKPSLPIRILRWFCHPDLIEDVEGDLNELYEEKQTEKGSITAKWVLWLQVIKLFRSGIIKPVEGSSRLNQYGMFKNNFKIALRTFKSEKAFTLINVFGLTAGIWCVILITLWVQDEFRYDSFHENEGRIYQVLRNSQSENGKSTTNFGTAYPIGDALEENIPEIVARVRVARNGGLTLEIKNELTEAKLSAVDPSFFKVFSFPLEQGNVDDCLSDLSNMVISQRLADAYFLEESAIGKTVSVLYDEHRINFKISGVLMEIPEHSSFQFDALIQIDNFLPFTSTYRSWGNSWMSTYVLLNERGALTSVNQKIKDLPKKIANVDWFTLMLHPYKDMYLYSKFENGKVAGGRIDYVVLFSLIAVFTLLIACFNFINLTTARSGKRSKEIGIKKVMGAGRRMLIGQFFLESTMLVFASVLLAILLALLSLDSFNDLASKNLSIDFFDIKFYTTLLIIAGTTVLLSGIYPATFLSSFNPINALKGKLSGAFGHTFLRKGLLVFQFSISMILIAGATIIYMQLSFIQNKYLGLEKQNVIYSPLNIQTFKHKSAFIAELEKHPGINQISSSGGIFIQSNGSTSDPKWEGKSPDPGQLWFSIMDTDFGLLEMLKIELVDGRFFNSMVNSDSLNYMINEEAAKIMGIEEPIGKSMKFWGEDGGRIIGVVKDFHFESLHSPLAPMIIRCRPSNSDVLYIKTEPNKSEEVLAYMTDLHDQFSTLPLESHFLDKTIEKGYKEDKEIQKLAGGFSAMAILISCLGLLGLASFSAQQRTKEIAIRKVLGAKVVSLIRLLFDEYFKLILVGIFIGAPIAHYWTTEWLQEFTYRVEISFWVYLLPAFIVLFVALFTISKLSYQTANTNPVDSLRDE